MHILTSTLARRVFGSFAGAPLVLGLLFLSLAASPATADEDPAFLSAGIGYYDILDDEGAADFRLEYRHDAGLWKIKPWAGLEVTSDAAVYGAVGLLLDIYFGKRFVITPSFGAGLYEDGDGKDLGSVIEFRSQIEAAFRFNDRSRLGVAFGHISNASIGDDNPGTEILNVYYHLPLDKLF